MSKRMSELQDALDRNEEVFKPTWDESMLFAIAARRVANLDMEAAIEIINRLRYIETGDEWDDKIDDIAKLVVNAALGITTEDDE